MSTREDDAYEVGYKKPPKKSQFKKGQSGNLKGRPKGSRNIATLLEEALFRKVAIRDERGSRKVTFVEALVHKMSVDALKGDPRAAAKIIELLKYHDARRQDVSDEGNAASDSASFKVTQADLDIMRSLARGLDVSVGDIEEAEE